MDFKRISRRSALRLTALGGLAGAALTARTTPPVAAAGSDSVHPAIGVWENVAPRIDVQTESYDNQFAFLFGGVAIFNSPPMDLEPGTPEQWSGPFFGVWEATGANSIAFSVRHGLYSAHVFVNGFEGMFGTAVVSSDGASLEVIRTFQETDVNGVEQYHTTRTATFDRQKLRQSL